eukprot:gene22214-28328_t
MGCPAPLQPHQIQGGVGGSDYPALHQAIVWLVKKYFERRGEREEQLRDISTFQFSKNYTLPAENGITGTSINLSKILGRHKAVRAYKRKENSNESEETRVRSCLLEFGESFTKAGKAAGTAGTGGVAGGGDDSVGGVKGGDAVAGSGGEVNLQSGIKAALAAKNKKAADAAASGGSAEEGRGGMLHVPVIDSVSVTLAGLSKLDTAEMSGFERQLAKAARDAKKEDALFAEAISKEETELMKQMRTIDEQEATAVSGSSVGNIVSLGSSDIGAALAAYQAELELSRTQMESNLASGKLGQAAAYNRQKQNLLKQKEEIAIKESEVRNTSKAMGEKLSLMEEDRDGAEDYIEQLKAQLKKLADLEAAATQQEELVMLKNLVGLNESLRGQEAAFKASCKAQMADFTARLKACDLEESEDTDENRKLRDIEDMHGKVLAKYNKLRQLLAETNLEVANAVRTIDDVPTRTELIQYERRFVELYQQVAWKLEETRKYYDIYNTLDTTLGFLQKEVKLLNSISENFVEAMKSTQSKVEYSKQFENIVKGVEDSLQRQERQLVQKDQKVEELKVVHQNLVDEQRRYFKAVKDFQEECNKNDWLSSKLETITRQ